MGSEMCIRDRPHAVDHTHIPLLGSTMCFLLTTLCGSIRFRTAAASPKAAIGKSSAHVIFQQDSDQRNTITFLKTLALRTGHFWTHSTGQHKFLLLSTHTCKLITRDYNNAAASDREHHELVSRCLCTLRSALLWVSCVSCVSCVSVSFVQFSLSSCLLYTSPSPRDS